MLKTATCACATCNVTLPIRDMIKVDKNNRGGAAAYLCNYHARRMEGYSYEHDRFSGKEKAHGFTYGEELKSMADSARARMELQSRDFVATSDCTVRIEYKSPIFHGLNALSKDCKTVEELNARGELDTIHENCGCHLNIGHVDYINSRTVDYIRRFCHSLFIPVSKVMSENPDKVKAIFGREFNTWAEPYTNWSNATTHENWINLQHNNRIEFRVCKFINAKQYMTAAKCATEMMTAIINNFVKHFNDEPKDSRRYSNITEYRKHKAEVTAQKLVKIFWKYAEMV